MVKMIATALVLSATLSFNYEPRPHQDRVSAAKFAERYSYLNDLIDPGKSFVRSIVSYDHGDTLFILRSSALPQKTEADLVVIWVKGANRFYIYCQNLSKQDGEEAASPTFSFIKDDNGHFQEIPPEERDSWLRINSPELYEILAGGEDKGVPIFIKK